MVAGRYLVTRILGRGGMGEVYEAADQLLGEGIALKTLRADLAREDHIVRHFQKEIQLARKVTHPNVCRVFETGVHTAVRAGLPPLPYFTMELLRGEPLSARIGRNRRLSRAEAFPIAQQMAEGLQAAHGVGIVHADFKSGNVFLVPGSGGDRVVITDFGLAHIDPSAAMTEETRTISNEVRVVGTVAYMSPEQMTGGRVTAASDIYSFGIVLYEMATGELPFDQRHVIHSAVQRVSSDGLSARVVVPDLDPRWDEVISRCLQSDPQKRFTSAAEIAACFTSEPRRSWTRRDVARIAIAGSVPLLALGAYRYWSRRPYVPPATALRWYEKGIAALHSMTYETARRAFEQAVRADPAYAMAHANLARAYEELDYSDLAKEAMLRAVGVSQDWRPSAGEAVRLRALQFLVARDYDRAAPLFQELERAAAPADRPAAALEAGWLAQLREDTEGAAAAYERALKLNPNYAAAKLRLGFILGRRRQIDDALKAFGEAEALYRAESDEEGVTQTLYERSRLLNRSSRSAEALPVIENALAIAVAVGNPYQQISLQLAQGVAVRNLGDSARAAALARQAIDAAVAQRMDNVATNALIDLGNSYLAAGDSPSAEPSFRRALDLAGRGKVGRNEARARLALASLCEQDRRAKEARQFVEAALPFFRQAGYRREFVQAMTILGGVHQQLAEFELSATVLREALTAAVQLHDRQTEGKVHERLGETLRDQGAWPDAVMELDRAATLIGTAGAEARLNCALLYARLGREREAEAALAEATNLLQRRPNRQLASTLQRVRAGIAYEEGRIQDAGALLPDNHSDPEVNLLAALVRLRTHPRPEDVAASMALVERMDREALPADAASARLELAQAFAGAAHPSPPATQAAARLAQEALPFFESRHIAEASWRAHSLIARATQDPQAIEAQRSAAREALAKLTALWTSAGVEGYLKRPDIRALSAGLI